MRLHQAQICTAKETANKMKRLPTEWDNIFANETSAKGFISKLYKEFIQLSINKTKMSIYKWEKNMNRHFSKKDMQMTHRQEKTLSLTNHQTNVNPNHNGILPRTCRNVSTSINQQRTSVGENVEKREPLCNVGGSAN